MEKLQKLFRVAPRVGAWIETKETYANKIINHTSHPVWVRGLKLSSVLTISMKWMPVAPRVGAWIETLGIGTKEQG